MLVKTRDFQATVSALLFDPGFYAFDFVADRGLTKFLVVEETMLEQSPFIDIRFEPLAQGQFWVDTSELFALEGHHGISRPGPAFIFHHAFACSTLVARCLNQIDAFFSLKEPWILRRLADYKRAQGRGLPGTQWRNMFCNYVRLLCRNFRTGRTPVIKATNVANNLLVDVLRFMPGQKVLYLHSDLEGFLISNLKKPGDTQQKIPGLAQAFLEDSDFQQKYPEMSNLSRLSFLQDCALIWLVNLYTFKSAVEQHGIALARTLDVEAMLGDRPGSLEALSRFFGHAPDAAEVQRMIDPRVTETNAKDQSRPYGARQRQDEMREIGRRHEQELAGTRAWIEPVVSESGVLEFLHSRRLTA